MSAACTLLDGDLTIDCTDPIQGGVEDTMYLVNKDDIDLITRDGSNPLIVTGVTLKSGATAYKVEGQNNSHNTKWEIVRLPFGVAYKHMVDFVGFDLSPAALARFEKIGKGKFVAFVVNNYKGTSGDAAIDIIGLDSGLICATMSRDASAEDTQGAVPIQLATSEKGGNKEPHVFARLYDTDYATSLAIME